MKILILARMSSYFTGNTVNEKPLGGSESALFYLGRELARLGHEIVIYNNCGKAAGIYENVEYRQFTTLTDLVKHSKEKNYDIFISFRDLTAFLFPVKASKRIWWGHDDFSNVWNYSDFRQHLGRAFLRLSGYLINRYCDELFVVSRWLGDICIEKVYIRPEKIYVTKNGIYWPYFEERDEEKRDRFRLVYTSVPDRGLDVLLDMFPDIRKEVPEATLHIYCGWDLGMLKESDRKRAAALYEKTNQPGVVREGTKKHSDLAKELLRSSLMLYPSHAVPVAGFFAETSCIAALESQAAGCPVIASNRGALSESIKNRQTGILIDGDPCSAAYKETFIKETVGLLKDSNHLEQMRKSAVNFIHNNYAWDLIAKEWSAKFEGMFR